VLGTSYLDRTSSQVASITSPPRFIRASVLAIPLLGAFISGALFSAGSYAAQLGPDAATATHSPQTPPDQGSDIVRLMTKLEAAISAGRLNAPAGDNAMETLEAILTLVPDAQPSDLDALDSMPSRLEQRVAEARARGDKQAAERLSVFRDAFGLAGRAASTTRTLSTPNAPAPPPASAAAPPTANPAPAADRSAAGAPHLEHKPPEAPAASPEARPGTVAALPNPEPVPGTPLKLDQAKSAPALAIADRSPGSDLSAKRPDANPGSASPPASAESRPTEEAALPKPAQLPNAPLKPTRPNPLPTPISLRQRWSSRSRLPR
jgi:hypothetical protein